MVYEHVFERSSSEPEVMKIGYLPGSDRFIKYQAYHSDRESYDIMAESLEMLGATSKAMRQVVRSFFYSTVKIYLTDFGQPETDAGYFEVLFKLLSKIGDAGIATLRELRIDISPDKTADRESTANKAFQAFLPLVTQCHGLNHWIPNLRCLTSSFSILTHCTRTSSTTSH